MTIFMCLKRRIVLAAVLLAALSAGAERLHSPTYGYAIDLPEGFFLADKTEDNRNYLFQSDFLVTQCVIRINGANEFGSAAACLDALIRRLQGEGEAEDFLWKAHDCAVANLTVQGGLYSGQAACFSLPQDKGFLSVVAFSPAEQADNCMQIHLSILDAVYVDEASYFSQGIFTAYAFPRTQSRQVQLQIAGKKISTVIDRDDEEAENFVINREFAVMRLYMETEHPGWKEAWQRYYRQIYRASFERLNRAAFDILNALNTDELTEIQYAQLLLSWVQGMDYRRDQSPNSADLAPVTAVLQNKGSDCDSRSMLLCILMQQAGIDAAMYVSREFSHALMGIAIDAPGQFFESAGQRYLLGETTAPVTFGTAPQDVQQRGKWVDILLP